METVGRPAENSRHPLNFLGNFTIALQLLWVKPVQLVQIVQPVQLVQIVQPVQLVQLT